MAGNRVRVIVWGAGGHGKVMVDALLAGNSCEVVGIIDDDPRKTGKNVLGVPVLGFGGGLLELMNALTFDGIALAIGDNYTRYEKFQELRNFGLKPVNVIHPSAHISRFVELGEGITILAGATINPGAVIEDNVCVNTAASVDHDDYLAMSCHVLPNATLGGAVRVEEFAYIGAGAVVKQNQIVHKYSYVGAGAVVVKDVLEGAIVCGVPAANVGCQPKRPCGTSVVTMRTCAAS
jgi:sugar O-acyltransferase (sialic acid O-acetyltransferase NeuD family)